MNEPAPAVTPVSVTNNFTFYEVRQYLTEFDNRDQSTTLGNRVETGGVYVEGGSNAPISTGGGNTTTVSPGTSEPSWYIQILDPKSRANLIILLLGLFIGLAILIVGLKYLNFTPNDVNTTLETIKGDKK